MYSLNYSAKNGWTLWADTNLGPLLVNQGSFSNCWNFRTMMELRRKGVYKPYEHYGMVRRIQQGERDGWRT